MKRLILTIVLTAIIASPMSGTAAPGGAGKRDQGRQAARESLEERFSKLGRELDELRSKIGPLTEEARREMDRYRGEAQKKGREAAKQLEELRDSIEKKWDEFSNAMDAAIEEFEREFEQGRRKSERERPGASDRTI